MLLLIFHTRMNRYILPCVATKSFHEDMESWWELLVSSGATERQWLVAAWTNISSAATSAD